VKVCNKVEYTFSCERFFTLIIHLQRRIMDVEKLLLEKGIPPWGANKKLMGSTTCQFFIEFTCNEEGVSTPIENNRKLFKPMLLTKLEAKPFFKT